MKRLVVSPVDLEFLQHERIVASIAGKHAQN